MESEMPNITIEEVEKVAALAKLEFTGEEKQIFTEQFSKIVGFIEQIGQLNTDNILPTTHAVEKKNVLREDKVIPSMPNEAIGKIAPKFSDGSIVVPKIIEY
jgi:aspartyl-tRNA(Asn)/glutamyl-tRNA(Gln) amidotransferase subunit C